MLLDYTFERNLNRLAASEMNYSSQLGSERRSKQSNPTNYRTIDDSKPQSTRFLCDSQQFFNDALGNYDLKFKREFALRSETF